MLWCNWTKRYANSVYNSPGANHPGGHASLSRGTVDKLTKQHDLDTAKEVISFINDHVFALKETADKEKLDCDALLTRYIETYLSQTQADEVKHNYDEQMEAAGEFFRDVNYIKPEVVENVGLILRTLQFQVTIRNIWHVLTSAGVWCPRSQGRVHQQYPSILAVQVRHWPPRPIIGEDFDQCPDPHPSIVCHNF